MKKGHRLYRNPNEERRLKSLLSVLYSLAYETRESKNWAIRTVFPLLDGISQSLESTFLLARRERLRDMYALSRMIYESSINTCFILAKGEAAAERAWRHAEQKAVRDLKRSVQFGDEVIRLEHEAADEALNDPYHQKVLAEFTTKKGWENREWTPENLNERMRVILDKFGRSDSVGLAYGQFLYRHASEMLHGTLFSGIFVYGRTGVSSPKNVAELREFRRDQISLVMMLLGITMDSLIRIIAVSVDRVDLVGKTERIHRRWLTKRFSRPRPRIRKYSISRFS